MHYNKMKVNFYDSVDDGLLRFAVIISQASGKWVFCKHRERQTLEVPGGHRESGEPILETAKHELQEETVAVDFTLSPICVYSVVEDDGSETYGMLYVAEIFAFAQALQHEISQIFFLDKLPDNWTYPLIQPRLITEAVRRNAICLDGL